MKKLKFVTALGLILLMAFPAWATVSSETTRVKYTCNGTTTVYAYPFKIYEDDDLLAIKALTATGAETTLVLNTDYTVSGAGITGGGNLTLTSGSVCASGYTMTILRNIELTQETDYVDGQAFSAESLESAIDKTALIQQQQAEAIGRAPKLPKTSSIADIALPNPAASHYIGWNAGATQLENKASPVALTTATQYEIDALVTYGGGTSFTQATIESALTAIGTTNKVTLLLRPGTWVISSNADWSVYTNVTFKIVPGAVISHGAFTVNIPNLDLTGLHQRFSGAGAVTLTRIPYVYPEFWTDHLTPGTTDMTTAIASAIVSGIRLVKFGPWKYAYTTLTIPDGTFDLTLLGTAVEYDATKSTQLWFTPSTGNGLYLAGAADYLKIEDITFNAHNAESDSACIADADLTTKVVRSLVLDNVHIYGWKSAIVIGYSVKISFKDLYLSGQGSAVSGGTGITIGHDVNRSNNIAIVRDSQIVNYEKSIWNQYGTSTVIDSTTMSLAAIGLDADVGIIYTNNGYFESDTVAIDKAAAAYVYGSWQLTGSTPAANTLANHRFARHGEEQSRMVAYDLNAQTITGGAGMTVITLQHLEESDDLSYVIATDLYTARYQGHYLVTPYVTFSATAAAQAATVQVFKATPPAAAAAIPYFDGVYQSSAAGTIGGSQTRLIWLEAGDTLQVKASTDANMAVPAARLDVVSLGL